MDSIPADDSTAVWRVATVGSDAVPDAPLPPYIRIGSQALYNPSGTPKPAQIIYNLWI